MPSEGVPKCQRCRKDHKKCSPENRQWPGPKCDRCESYGYECSENVMARRSSQKDDLPRSMRGFMQDLSQAKYFDYQNGARALTVRPPQTPILNSMPHSFQHQSLWINLFGYLRDINWFELRCSAHSPGSSPFIEMFRSATCPVPDLLIPPLGCRQMYLEAFWQSQRLMQHLTASVSSSTALQESINILVTEAQRQYPHLTMSYSFEELARLCGDYIRHGSQWNEVRTELQSDEVMLIDPHYSFDANYPTATTFESAKAVWLCPGLGLKQFCQKLAGLSQMMSNLARTDLNSEARTFLATKIYDRLQEVLGPYPAPPNATLPSYPASPMSLYPPFALESSPVEMMDSDPYSSPDDTYSPLDGSLYYSATLGNPCFNEQVWSN